MQVSVVKIGNSRGIRIPKKILDQCQVEDTFELIVKDHNILLKPIHKIPREGWAEAAKRCHALDDDVLMIADVWEDDESWEW